MVDASSPRILLQLLAAPRLLINDHPAHVGSRKALAILSMLALDGGATRERLSDYLWPEGDTATGRRNLRRELFRLRKLGVPLQEAADGALALDDVVGVDALQLLHEDRLPRSNGSVLEGLDGIGSIEFDAWLQRWREQISHRHSQLLSREAALSEERGDLTTALMLYAQRWNADSCDEASAVNVIRLRAALGDRAGALQAYERLAETLRDDLGLEPSEAARTLSRTLREQLALPPSATLPPVNAGPTKSAAPPVISASLPTVVPFIPRTRVQKQIESAWSRGQRVYLHGPAGIGKTRLASEIAAARGPWLRVACEPQDSELPYSSVVRVLRALRESAPDVVLPDWVRRELSQLMREFGEPPQALATDEARQRLLSAVAEAWRLLMHDNFSAFVLDDWHWGDAASVELWTRLDDSASVAAGTVAWIIGYRSAQLPTAALERQREDIDSRRGVAVALEGMDEAEVLSLTHVLSGSSGGRLFSQRLRDATEGNPFFLLETLRHLFEQGLLVADQTGWSTPFDEGTERYDELPVPASVRAAVQARVRALGVLVQRLLEVASLGGGEIDVRLLAAVSNLDEGAAIAALEHAEAAHLVQETATGWRFAHDLVRQSLVHGLSMGRRRLLHERLAGRLELEGTTPALVAAQWEAAQLPAAAVRWRVAAAEAALRVHALNEALASYAQALADGASGAAAAAIHLACADVHRRRADRAAADDAFTAAAGAASVDPETGQAAVLNVQLARAEYLCVSDRIDEGLAALDALTHELAGAAPEARAKALAVRGVGLMRQGKYNAAEALLTEAEALFEDLPRSRRELAALLLDLTRCSNWRGDIEAWGRNARRAVAVYESVDDAAGLSRALSLLSLFHKYRGESQQALAVGERARALAARSGNVPAHRSVNFNLLQALMDSGHTDRVLLLIEESEALAPSFENQLIELNFRAARFFVHFLRGEVAEAGAAGSRLLDLAKRRAPPLARIGYLHMVADLYIDIGDWQRARELIDEAKTACDAQRAGGEDLWFTTNQAFKQTTLALAEGRPADALALLPTAALDEVDNRFHHAHLGAAAARALGDAAGARRRLDAVGIDEAAPVHPLACWLEQRLILAAEEGRGDAAAVARVETLLDERRVPALLVDRLRRALDAAPR